jgi:hypothetical protein
MKAPLATPLFFALIEAHENMAELIDEAYMAHHGKQGIRGCPLCAEYADRLDAAIEAITEAVEKLEEFAKLAGAGA